MKEVNVRELGAVGDGIADDAPAIQKALDSGAQVVQIPEGSYKLGKTLKVRSNTTIRADKNAVIRIGDGVCTNRDDFILTNKNREGGDKSITIEGGVWDGNNAANVRGSDGDMNAYTGSALNFVNVKNLILRKFTVFNPDGFFIRLGEVEDFLVEDIRLAATNIRPNQDGVHVGGFSHRGIIRRIKAEGPMTPNDDMVALNADDDVERALNLGMKRGPISDILVEDISADDAWTFVRILSCGARVRDVQVRRVSGGCRYYAVNFSNWRYPEGSGDIRNVTFSDVSVFKSAVPRKAPAIADLALNVQNLRITGLTRRPETIPEALTLLLHNQRTNHVEIKMAGGEKRVFDTDEDYSVPDGSIDEFALNPERDA